MRIRSQIVRSILAVTALAFALGAAHASLHDLQPPGSGPALHGVACDDAHAEPRCPVCFGKAPTRSAHRGPVSLEPLPAHSDARRLHPPGSDRTFASRIVRPEAARAPPLSG